MRAPEKRVVICTTDGKNAFNGINSWLLTFLPSLRLVNVTPKVFVFCWNSPNECFTLPELRRLGIEVKPIFPQLYTESAVRYLAREVGRLKPDAFIGNMVVPALYATPLLQKIGVPCISVLHNLDTEYSQLARIEVDATVVISQSLRQLINNTPRLVRFIPYGVAEASGIAKPPTDGEFRIIYHGRISQAQKRIIETVQACRKICNRYPRVTADFYGSGPETALLESMLAKEDCEGRIAFRGPKSASEIRKVLPQYHASLLLSDYEGLGLSLIEAMIAGVVPVCLDSNSGTSDFVLDGINALVVSDREQSVVDAIGLLLSSTSLWHRLSERARTDISEKYSLKHCSTAWRQLIEDVNVITNPGPLSLPSTVPSALADHDFRYPGVLRAVWRWIRFGPEKARRPW